MPIRDLYVLAWNTQGNRWDHIFPNLVAGNPVGINPAIIPAGYNDHPTAQLVGIITEAGTPPFVDTINQQYIINQPYPFGRRSFPPALPPPPPPPPPPALGTYNQYGRFIDKSYWVPWVKTIDTKFQNPRVSLGGFATGVGATEMTRHTQLTIDGATYFPSRPVICISIASLGLTVFQIHLKSGGSAGTLNEFFALLGAITQIIPSGTMALIVGDININILNVTTAVLNNNLATQGYPHWRYIRSNQATQQKGGELDYALLYDPRGVVQNHSWYVVESYYNGVGPKPANKSDHSMMLYKLTIRT